MPGTHVNRPGSGVPLLWAQHACMLPRKYAHLESWTLAEGTTRCTTPFAAAALLACGAPSCRSPPAAVHGNTVGVRPRVGAGAGGACWRAPGGPGWGAASAGAARRAGARQGLPLAQVELCVCGGGMGVRSPGREAWRLGECPEAARVKKSKSCGWRLSMKCSSSCGVHAGTHHWVVGPDPELISSPDCHLSWLKLPHSPLPWQPYEAHVTHRPCAH